MGEEAQFYKAHTGMLAWPTLALLVGVVVLWVGSWVGVLTGAIGLAVGAVGTTIAAYLSFTVMHEAAHGNIHGSRRDLRGIGTAAGWLASAFLLAPFPAFRVLHLRHHSFTNDGRRDPDFFVAGTPLLAPLRCFRTIPHYYGEFLFGETSRSNAGRRERRSVILGILFLLAIGGGLSAFGLWREVLFLWAIPAVVAAAILAFFFDYVPHHPHASRERYRDTRVVPTRLLDLPLLGQNLHLVHHLWPRVPFYRYRAVFEASRDRLVDAQAPGVSKAPTLVTSPEVNR
ncbi:MAG: fatty acid desaturase [Myxococcota bacterium]